MTVSANTVWEVRTTGNDGNGGGFVTGASGTDRSQQDAAHATLTTSSTVHTTTTQINVAVGDYTVTTNDVGNIFQLTSGTATAGFYQITAVDTGNNRWTVDRSVGTAGQTVAGAMGGALASTGKLGASSALQAGNRVWVKSGTYTLTTTTDNVSGGPLNANGFATGLVIEGYQTTRGDRAARPVISAGSVTGLSNGIIRGVGSRSAIVINMEYDANNGTGNTAGFQTTHFYRCVVRNASVANASGFGAGCTATRCAAINCTTGFNGSYAAFCIADGSTVNGFFTLGSHNIATGCTTGFATDSARQYNSVAYGGTNGFTYSATTGGVSAAVNCIAYGNSQYGFRNNTTQNGLVAINCAGGNNTSGNFLNCYEDGSITLTADPFTNAAGDDFSINNTAGGGALLRAAGIPFGDGTSYNLTEYLDVGAIQHQDTGGGGGTGISRARGASGF